MKFEETVIRVRSEPLMAVDINTLQVNLGYVCNLSCSHCHVDAGPHRAEMMTDRTVDAVLNVLRCNPIDTLDITGGSPELNPNFKRLVSEAKKLDRHVICRTNLAIIFEEGMIELPEFYKKHRVELTASLPCYLADNVDRMRGSGTFEKSIKALKILNKLGYGINTDLKLNLVYNPFGDFIAPSEQLLEGAYKSELKNRFGISFTRLYAFNNMPIGRFRNALLYSGNLENYMAKLTDAFNPCTLEGVMCRHLINVRWDGRLFDCDFNQMLDIPLFETDHNITDFNYEALSKRKIAVDNHCYGCVAGHGFTCMGAVTASKS